MTPNLISIRLNVNRPAFGRNMPDKSAVYLLPGPQAIATEFGDFVSPECPVLFERRFRHFHKAEAPHTIADFLVRYTACDMANTV